MAALARMRGLFTDVDDTITTAGRLPAEAYAALERLADAGLQVVPITGRPAGWCDHIARLWPVAGVVGENGALYYRYDRAARRMIRGYAAPPEQRERQRALLRAIGERVVAAVPGAAIAADQPFRESDLAVDYCEDVTPLDGSAVERIVRLLRAEGLSVKVSSIHVNAWFGAHDKLSMTRRLMREQFSVDLDGERERYVFAGDSPNDAPMFAYFPHSVGVANVARFAHAIATMPRYVTSGESAAGFVELAEALLFAQD